MFHGGLGAAVNGRSRKFRLVVPLELRIRLWKQGVHVAPVEVFEAAPDQLHVLLRHRLLRQPGGFEGSFRIAERRESEAASGRGT